MSKLQTRHFVQRDNKDVDVKRRGIKKEAFRFQTRGPNRLKIHLA